MPEQAHAKLFNEILAATKSDPNIIGFFLDGSRGKGLITAYSDYDMVMVVKDSVKKEYKDKYGKLGRPDIEITVLTLDELKKDAAWDSPSVWNRYNYAHLKVQVDKTGEVQKIVNEKALIPKDKRDTLINNSLDHYINQVYRSIKCLRDGNKTAANFEAAESIPPLLDAIFALEYRVKPYYK